MEKSKVFFTDLRTRPGMGLATKMINLVKAAGLDSIDFEGRFTAIKIHFGEPGNLAYLRPNYAAKLVDHLRERGAKVFLTDSNTLYMGGRSNAVDHLASAMDNGYNPMSCHANVIIADGLKGTDYKEIALENASLCPAPKIGAAVADADIIISMNHFKGHGETGFGGALKNLGMGCASVGGKMELHCSSKPGIDTEHCTGCGQCVKYCRHQAVTLHRCEDGRHMKASIDYDKCVGCGQCVAVCQKGGAVIGAAASAKDLNWKIAEYALAVVKDKPSFHINFIMNVSPECDCWNHNDAAIVPDLGIAASFDPVALDCACADIVNAAPALSRGTYFVEQAEKCACAHDHSGAHENASRDKFRVMHPDTCWEAGVEHGEEIGLGSRDYELIKL